MKIEDFFPDIINNLHDGVYIVNTNREILFWNDSAQKITGYSADEMLGMPCQFSKLNHIDEGGHPLCVVGCPLFHTLEDGLQRQDQVFVRHKDGYRIPIHVNVFPIRRDNKIIAAVEIFTQNSPTVYEDDLISKLSDSAMHDPLTQLPNRRYLESFLSHKIEDFQRFGRPFAVLFADIDNFSHFNNNYGHDIGDAVIKNVAESIKRTVRHTDLVGRWAGDEYVGIYSITDSSDLPVIGERFRQLMQNTEVICDTKVLNISVSVGITAVLPGDTINTIVERADSLMYHSKESGKNIVTHDYTTTL